MIALIDTNILIYAINSSSPKSELARNYILKHQDSLCVTHQNIFESIRVLTHPKYPHPLSPQKALDIITNITDSLYVIHPQDETDVLAAKLIREYQIKANQVFDAYLAATMLSNEINRIVTDNVADFQLYSSIKVINPFS